MILKDLDHGTVPPEKMLALMSGNAALFQPA